MWSLCENLSKNTECRPFTDTEVLSVDVSLTQVIEYKDKGNIRNVLG